MTDMKRVAFASLGADLTVRRASAGTFSAAALFQDDEAMMLPPASGGAAGPAPPSSAGASSPGRGHKTLRFKLELFDPNADSFPEFNYSKMVHVEKKKIKKQSKSNGMMDPFDENDDDVAKIAKEFEKKYSGAYATKGRNKKDDYYDKGAGYDESDSFIDNTEAYDEIIPEEVETVGGGFYINSGALEFTHLADDDNIKAVKSRKRALSSSSSSGNEDAAGGGSKDKTNKKASTEEIDGKLSPKDCATNGKVSGANIEKKLKVVTEEVTDLSLKVTKHHKDRKLERIKIRDVDGETLSDSGNEKEKEKDRDKVVKTTTVKDMLKAKRDNFRKMQQEEDAAKTHVNGEKMSDSEDSSATATESEVETEPPDKRIKKSADGDEVEKMRTTDVKLPEDLPDSVLKDVEELKVVIRKSNQTGKSFHFTDEMIEIFLRIDEACSCLDKAIRNQIFAHLEYQLSLAKYYFLRKARTLRIKQERNKTKRAYLKLKKAVAEVMPSILINYEANCRKIDDLRTIASQNNIDSAELPKYPKKKFIWNDTIRNLLFELYQVRWTSYVVLRTRKETLNDFITNYLKEKVVPIWPQNWMKYEELKKELEKRKKPKDTSKKYEGEELPSTKRNVEIDKLPSILTNNSNVSIISTKDLVVTISTKSDKKPEVPLSSSDTLTVTPILKDTTDESGSRSAGGNKVAEGVHQKSHKSSSLLTLSSTAGVRSVSPLSQIQSGGNLKAGHVSPGTHSSSKYSGENKTSSEGGSSQSNQGASKKQHSSSCYDLSSPAKRATDHSINSIMSSRTTPSPTHHSSSSSSASNQGSTSQPATTTKNSTGASGGSGENPDTAITHLITVDDINISDIIQTSNKLINNGVNSNATGATPSTANGAIRIRTVANVNSSVDKVKEKDGRKDTLHSAELMRPSSRTSSSTIEEIQIRSDSDSDGVEIVGVFPVTNKKKLSQLPPIPVASSSSASLSAAIRPTGSKHKGKKASSSSSRSESPNVVSNMTVHNSKRDHATSSSSGSKGATVNSRYDSELIGKERNERDSELDVLQIMQALKDLEIKLNSANASKEALSMYSRYNDLVWRLVNEHFKSLSESSLDRSFHESQTRLILQEMKEMQSKNIHISSSKSPGSNRPGGGSHASSINYI